MTLTAVLERLLAVPIFLPLTASREPASRATLVRVVAITVFSVLAVSALLGEAILTLIGASLSAFRVRGGLLLLLMSLSMLNAPAGGVPQSRAEAAALEIGELSGGVPPAVPLLAPPR